MDAQPTRKLAKMCTNHIGGRLGRMLMEQFAEKGWIERENAGDKHYVITKTGEKEFGKLGIDISQLKAE